MARFGRPPETDKERIVRFALAVVFTVASIWLLTLDVPREQYPKKARLGALGAFVSVVAIFIWFDFFYWLPDRGNIRTVKQLADVTGLPIELARIINDMTHGTRWNRNIHERYRGSDRDPSELIASSVSFHEWVSSEEAQSTFNLQTPYSTWIDASPHCEMRHDIHAFEKQLRELPYQYGVRSAIRSQFTDDK